MTRKQTILVIAGAILLVAVTAGASSFITRDVMTPETAKTETAAAAPAPAQAKRTVQATKTHHAVQARNEQINWNQPAPQQPAPVQQQARCDDGNIVGAAIGAGAGGLVGHQFGKGKGKDLATIGGVIAGGAAGHQMIPTRGVLCR